MSDVNQTSNNFRAAPNDLIPKWMIVAVLTLIFSVLALVTFARVTDRPLVAVPAETPIIAERLVVLKAAPNGDTMVTAPDGSLIEDIPGRDAGFISGISRVIDRERMKHNIDLATPVAIQRRDNGKIRLFDPATGWSAELGSFGSANARAFERVLDTAIAHKGDA